MDYQKLLDQLADGEIKEYTVEPQDAFAFQEAFRSYHRKQNIVGRALRGGKIIYTQANMEE